MAADAHKPWELPRARGEFADFAEREEAQQFLAARRESEARTKLIEAQAEQAAAEARNLDARTNHQEAETEALDAAAFYRAVFFVLVLAFVMIALAYILEHPDALKLGVGGLLAFVISRGDRLGVS